MHIKKTAAAAFCAAFFLMATFFAPSARAGNEPTLLGFQWQYDPAKSLRANLADDGKGAASADSFRLTGLVGGSGEAAFAAAQSGNWLTFGLTIAAAAGATYLIVCNGDETVTAGTGVFEYSAYTATGVDEGLLADGNPTTADNSDSVMGLVYAYEYQHGVSGTFENSAEHATTATAVAGQTQGWYNPGDVSKAGRYSQATIAGATVTEVDEAGDGATAESAPDTGDLASAPVERTTRKKRDKC